MLALGTAILATARQAQADEPGTTPHGRVSWTAPPECPAAERIQARVDEHPDRVTIDGVVRRSGSVFVLDLRIASNGEHGVRTLTDPDCATLTEAALVVIDLSLTPKAEPHPSSKPSEAVSVPSDRSSAGPVEPRVSIGGGLYGRVGLLPRFAMGPSLVGVLRPTKHLALTLSGAYLPSVDAISGHITASFRAWSSEASGCFVGRADPFELGVCAGVTFGAIEGDGSGARTSNASGSAAVFGMQTTARALWIIRGPLAFEVALGTSVLVLRPHFEVTGVGTIFDVSTVNGFGYLGPALAF